MLGPTLDALDDLPERDRIEVIVVETLGGATRERLRERRRPVVVVESERLPIPRLRYQGVLRARGRLVAILEDHARVEPGWAAALIEAHRGPLGGGRRAGRERQGRAGQLGRLLLRVRPLHGPASPRARPTTCRATTSPTSAPTCSGTPDVLDQGKWESWINDRLRADGVPIASTNAMVVRHIKPFRLGYFLAQRFHFARSYAGMRRADQSWPKRLVYGFGSLALPALLSARVARTVLGKKRHLGRFLLVSPLVGALPHGRGGRRDGRLPVRAGPEPGPGRVNAGRRPADRRHRGQPIRPGPSRARSPRSGRSAPSVEVIVAAPRDVGPAPADAARGVVWVAADAGLGRPRLCGGSGSTAPAARSSPSPRIRACWPPGWADAWLVGVRRPRRPWPRPGRSSRRWATGRSTGPSSSASTPRSCPAPRLGPARRATTSPSAAAGAGRLDPRRRPRVGRRRTAPAFVPDAASAGHVRRYAPAEAIRDRLRFGHEYGRRRASALVAAGPPRGPRRRPGRPARPGRAADAVTSPAAAGTSARSWKRCRSRSRC